MYKNLLAMLLMLLLGSVTLFAQEAVDEAEFVDIQAYEISDEISEPLAFNTGTDGSVYYSEIIPQDGMPQADIVGKPVDYATDYYTQYQQRDPLTTVLWSSAAICALACAVYFLVYMVY